MRTVAAFEQNFGQYMDGLKWINLGGGHHITRADYDVETLVHCIDYLQKKNVKKPNGAAPGFVVYYTNYSLTIHPDISGLTLVSD